jgi:hypothetical protein
MRRQLARLNTLIRQQELRDQAQGAAQGAAQEAAAKA